MECLDYDIAERLVQSHSSTLYRVKKTERTYLLRVYKIFASDAARFARFNYKLLLLKKLQLTGLAKIEEILYQSDEVVVRLQNICGSMLKQYCSKQPHSVEKLLPFAIALAQTVAQIHNSGIFHGDLKPGEIILIETPQQITITNMGLSFVLREEVAAVYASEELAATLPYIAPEQTHFLNCPVDYYSDFYSLGCILYEMFTGLQAFRAKSALEMFHAHIAKMPQQPCQINCKIPQVLSNIIMKLLAKEPQNRYRNAVALVNDLQQCQQHLTTCGHIKSFVPNKDYTPTLQIPHKLYGRELETATLANVLEYMENNYSTFVFISGEAGIGKTALVNTIRELALRCNAYFLLGKCEQHQKKLPYCALIEMGKDLVTYVLSEGETKIQELRLKILQALQPNGKLITDVIPDLEIIIDKQPDVHELPPDQAVNRFNLTFRNFISAFGQERPVIICLDDLQWADSASINLLQSLAANPPTATFVFIGVYRWQMFSPQILLPADNTCTVRQVKLGALQVEAIATMLSDTLEKNSEECRELAEIIYEKTAGNPFFIRQFLHSLFQEEILKVDMQMGWSWDIAMIEELPIHDDIAALLLAKITPLPVTAKNVLNAAACIGSKFDFHLLALVCEMDIDEIYHSTKPAIDNKLLRLTGGAGKFPHDRIHEAFYALATPESRLPIHRKIGELLSNNNNGESIFRIVKHLNIAAALISGKAERINLAELNLLAGRKAKAASAFSAARDYFANGIANLGDNSWTAYYQITLALYMGKAECDYINGNFTEAERAFHIIFEHISAPEERAELYRIKIRLYSHLKKYQAAILLGKEASALFGITVPTQVGKKEIFYQLLQLAKNFYGKSFDSLRQQEPMQDPEKIIAVNLLLNVMYASYRYDVNLYVFLALKTTNIYLQYGHAQGACLAYAICAMILGPGLGLYRLGYRLGKVAIAINEQHEVNRFTHGVYFIVGNHLNRWGAHLYEDEKQLQYAYRLAIQSGDLLLASISYPNIFFRAFVLADNLDALLPKVKKDIQILEKLGGDKEPILGLQAMLQLLLNLKGLTKNPHSFSDENFCEEKYLQQLKTAIAPVQIVYYMCKIMAGYFGRDNMVAIKIAQSSQPLLDQALGAPAVEEHHFFHMLLLCKACFCQKYLDRYLLKKLRPMRRKLRKWAKIAPQNARHRHLLMEAEICGWRGRRRQASEYYRQAIVGAFKNGFIRDGLIACELAAKFYYRSGDHIVAAEYMRKTIDGYRRWGAIVKAENLQKQFCSWLLPLTAGHTVGVAEKNIDFGLLANNLQSIAGVIDISRLLSNLLQIIVKISGAQKAFFVNNRHDQLLVEAVYTATTDKVELIAPLPIDKTEMLASPIVYYVQRTGRDVVLNNATQEGPFTSTKYILQQKPRSLLCMPLNNHNQLVAILYLENNFASAAFPCNIVQAVKIIAAQAAIAMENAMLYRDLQREIAMHRRTEAMLKTYRQHLEALVQKRTNALAVANKNLRKEIERRKIIESELQKKQKLESLGVLAGGIAHDFNNFLTAITGNISLVKEMSAEACHNLLDDAHEACTRAKGLTHQLLTFAKDGHPIKKSNNTQSLLANAVALSISGSNVQCHFPQDNAVWPIEVDATQFVQAISNILINAKNAMPNGGHITIRTTNITTPENIPVQPGKYVKISIADQGQGIAPEHVDKIFDPYFTTKATGTGLGLATTYSIVQKHNGHISVASERSKGTTFDLYFPAATLPATSCPVKTESYSGGGERILVMDDDKHIQTMIFRMLTRKGYQVTCVGDGQQAIVSYRQAYEQDCPYDVVIMDLTIPGGMGGKEAVLELRKINPQVKAIVSSGYCNDALMSKYKEYGFWAMLAKPYSFQELNKVLNDCRASF